MTEALAAIGLGLAAVGAWLWVRYSGEPERPEPPTLWLCAYPPSCVPGDPCSPNCGSPTGRLNRKDET